MQYDVASDEYREILKSRIMDQVEKYFMLIVFSMYCKQVYFHHLRIILVWEGNFVQNFGVNNIMIYMFMYLPSSWWAICFWIVYLCSWWLITIPQYLLFMLHFLQVFNLFHVSRLAQMVSVNHLANGSTLQITETWSKLAKANWSGRGKFQMTRSTIWRLCWKLTTSMIIFQR